MTPPEPEVTGLFAELTARDAAEAGARVRAALDAAGATDWGVGAVLPPAGDPRWGVEVFAPPRVTPAAAWELAHGLATALTGRVEPMFAGDVVPPELAPPEELLESIDGLRARVADWLAYLSRDDDDAPPDERWHHRPIGVAEAHRLLRERRIEPGADVRIGHPDTGYTEHDELGCGADAPILRELGANFMPGEPEDDPRDRRTTGPMKQPGHGTATASMIVARDGVRVPRRRGGDADLSGIAPAARVVPLRVTETVIIHGWQERLARAIEHAIAAGCHVVSISLGGIGGNRLERAVRRAEEAGVIVVAAAGNVVPFVVAPASDPLVVACAASRIDGRPWALSSAGAAVDITAPGHHVWAAGWDGSAAIAYPGSGSSFAAALTAGAAALWLCGHRDALRARGIAVHRWPALFRRALAATAERTTALAGGRHGAGLLRCDRLVAQSVDALLAMDAIGFESPDGLEAIAPDPRRVAPERTPLGALLEAGAGAPDRARETVESLASTLPAAARHELTFHLTLDPLLRHAWGNWSRQRPVLPSTLIPARASPPLRAALQTWLAAPP